MNFDDTPQEAAFRAQARAWIQANGPQELRAELELAGFGQLHHREPDAFLESASRRAAGPACSGRWSTAGGAPLPSSG